MNQRNFLTVKNPLYALYVKKYTIDDLANDEGSGDFTTSLFFDAPKRISAVVCAKQKGIFAGEQEIWFFLSALKKIIAQFYKHDGDSIKSGDILITLTGDVPDLMRTERIILNLIGRMSGIATLTERVVRAANKVNQKVLVTPTRKTLWGLLDKRACVLGGGGTHRLSLDNAIVIKHNHLRASGASISTYLEKVITKIKQKKLPVKFLEIEVSAPRDAFTAAKILSHAKKNGLTLPCYIMFDNFSPHRITQTLKKIKADKTLRGLLFEASGGITEKSISDYAKTGVDVISIGAFTHSAPHLDVSMRIP